MTIGAMTVQRPLALLAVFASQAALADDGWKLAKETDGVKVYTRSVADSPLKEFRDEIWLATSAEQVVKVLRDAGAFRKWMPDVVDSQLLTSSDEDQYHYLENKAPWPVSNRDGLYHFTYARADEAGAVVTTVRVEAAPDRLAKKGGKVRIPRSDGFWRIVGEG